MRNLGLVSAVASGLLIDSWHIRDPNKIERQVSGFAAVIRPCKIRVAGKLENSPIKIEFSQSDLEYIIDNRLEIPELCIDRLNSTTSLIYGHAAEAGSAPKTISIDMCASHLATIKEAKPDATSIHVDIKLSHSPPKFAGKTLTRNGHMTYTIPSVQILDFSTGKLSSSDRRKLIDSCGKLVIQYPLALPRISSVYRQIYLPVWHGATKIREMYTLINGEEINGFSGDGFSEAKTSKFDPEDVVSKMKRLIGTRRDHPIPWSSDGIMFHMISEIPLDSIHTFEYYDEIGNISTSIVKSRTHVELEPRYPLYGGWTARWWVSFSTKKSIKFSEYEIEIPLLPSIKSFWIDEQIIEVILPPQFQVSDDQFVYEYIKYETFWLDLWLKRQVVGIRIQNIATDGSPIILKVKGSLVRSQMYHVATLATLIVLAAGCLATLVVAFSEKREFTTGKMKYF